MNKGKIVITQVLFGLFMGIIISFGFMTLRNQTQPAAIIIEPQPTTPPPLPTPTPAPISVFVNGAVNATGVYELPFTARVADAIAVAGGFSANAYVEGVNLAAPLSDGVQIFVGDMAQSAEIKQTLLTNPIQASTTSATNNQPTSNGLININTASSSDLETIAGVGPSTAQSIISYREDNGPFTAIEEIMHVSGIGEKTFEKLRDSITISE